MAETDPVVIAGGGPVAMVLGLALYRAGVPFVVLETLPEPFVDQRAASYHPPTVEMLDALGLAEEIIPEGLKSPVYRFHDRVTRDVVAEFDQTVIEVAGHTDSTGSDEYNQRLSERRASSVSAYLISRQVLPERIIQVGMGEAWPVADNSTNAGRQLNRRVELTLVPLTLG